MVTEIARNTYRDVGGSRKWSAGAPHICPVLGEHCAVGSCGVLAGSGTGARGGVAKVRPLGSGGCSTWLTPH